MLEKNTNPFCTFEEATTLLRTMNMDPTSSGATYPFPWGTDHWANQVLAILVNRVYEGGNFYHKIDVQLTKEGFIAFLKALPFEDAHSKSLVCMRPMSSSSTKGFEEARVIINDLLEVFTVVQQGEEIVL